LSGDERTPIAALRHKRVYARRFISTIQARAMWGQSHPVMVGFPEYP
jgi:hypothetical protein